MIAWDAQAIDARFAATEPSRRETYLTALLSIAILLGVVLLPLSGRNLGLPSGASVVAVTGLVSFLMLVGHWAGRRQRRCREAIVRAWEHAELNRWEVVAATLERVLERPIQTPGDRWQAFMLLAVAAESRSRHDSAALIYETLLLRGIGLPLQLCQAQIALAAARIRNQELTDAVNLLSRLEQVPLSGQLKAALDLVRLFQQVFMGHHEDAVQNLGERRELYRRHLSTHAGYGYGLLSAALHHLGRRGEALGLWQDATLLLPADRLVHDYDVLGAVQRAYPAAEWPRVLRRAKPIEN